MATAVSTKRRPAREKTDVYQAVTDRIVAELEKGVVPWRKPWASLRPISLSTGKPYRGINVLLLALTSEAMGYTSTYWGTYKQIASRGGQVRKGEKGTQVVFWKWLEKEDDEGEARRIPFLRTFVVFNADQADGLELPEVEMLDHSPVEAAEAIVAGYVPGPKIEHGKDAAYYAPIVDMVGMPDAERFESTGRYYATLFHELAHSTGHESRIDRKLDSSFGAEDYSREELVAEIGSCFLLAEAGVEVEFEQSAAYVSGWLERLRSDKKLVASAAAAAQKAADLIVGRTFETKKED